MKEEVLYEYYTDLDYDNIDKGKVLQEVYDLSKTIKFDDSVTCSQKLERLADIVQDNMSLFKSVCRHIDDIDTILEYLINFAAETQYVTEDTDFLCETLLAILFTMFKICKGSPIMSLLIFPICTDYIWHLNDLNFQLLELLDLINLETDMIILEDSDLHAVINHLIITESFSLYKIWVQEHVKEKFLWLMKRHCSASFTIDTFRSLKDIQLREYAQFTISVISVWSEDIVAAKSFALSLNSHMIFINTHVDFYGSTVLFPYDKVFKQTTIHRNLIRLKKSDLTDVEQSVNVVHFSHTAEVKFTSRYTFFYDGTWQEPVKGMYWKHNDNLWANATNDDILRCCKSADEGFKIWSIKSIKTRIQILSKLESILKLHGKLVLADIVARWLKFPYLFPTIHGYLSHNRKVEVMQVRNPVGFIILREENENALFFRLMQTLIAGNSVIVMFGANFCNLGPYCDMFSICGIPPGVINLLSHEDTNVLGYKLCTLTYTNYRDMIFSKGNPKEKYIKPYLRLTMPKSIIVHLE